MSKVIYEKDKFRQLGRDETNHKVDYLIQLTDMTCFMQDLTESVRHASVHETDL